MKTLLFTLEYPPFFGGVSKYYEMLVRHWPDQRSIAVLDNNSGKLIHAYWPALKWLPSVWALGRAISQEKAGHVIVGQILPLGISAYVASKFFAFKYSIILHGMDLAYTLKSGRKRLMAGIALKHADKIICGNKYTQVLLEKHYGPEISRKAVIVNPGIEPDQPMPGGKDRERYAGKMNFTHGIRLFTLARIVKRKGIDRVIEALPEVAVALPEFCYYIAGTGPDEQYIRELAKKLPVNLQNKVIILGKISDEEKWLLLDACDIFIMPAREIEGDFEGFGVVYLEANLSGKPVIGGDSGGIADAVADGVSGILVDPESTHDIASAVIRLSQDAELRERLGRQGRERAILEFSWERQMRKLYDCILA